VVETRAETIKNDVINKDKDILDIGCKSWKRRETVPYEPSILPNIRAYLMRMELVDQACEILRFYR
jgi:hypothetical protein